MSTLRIVVRRLLAEPAFTAIAALTFSIGIGANLVVFTVVNTILLQQLPVPDSERLVILGHEPAGELHRPGQPQRVDAARVTASFFDVVQTLAQLGRTIQAEDERPDAPAVVLLSDELWQDRFGRASDVVGRVVEIDGTSTEIIGVAPSHFNFPDSDTRPWLTIRLDPGLFVSAIDTLDALVRRASAQRAFVMILLVVASAFALLIGAIGLYGVIRM